MDKVESYAESFKRKVQGLRFFDANCWIGRPSEPGFVQGYGARDLVDAMNYYGIDKALVTHWAAMEYNHVKGNEINIRELCPYPHLIPVAVIVPDTTSELQGLENYVNMILEQDVKAIRLFPRSHNYSIETWCSGPLFSLLEERRVPVILWHTEVSWNSINILCSTYRKLPLIVEGTGRKLLYDNRKFYALLAMHKNLHLEIHNLVGYLGIDDIVKKFGSEKLIFGSYMLQQDPSTSQMLITHGEFSIEHQRNIAANNLDRLIEGIAF